MAHCIPLARPNSKLELRRAQNTIPLALCNQALVASFAKEGQDCVHVLVSIFAISFNNERGADAPHSFQRGSLFEI